MQSVREIISDAMARGQRLRIAYRDYYGTVTEREILPLAWVDYGKINAFCYLREAERHFRLDNMLSCEHVSKVTPRQVPPSERTSTRSFDHEVPTVDIQPTARKIARRQARVQAAQQKRPPLARFSHVKTADQWSRLVSYYAECLVRENLQQYVIKNEPSSRLFFSAGTADIHGFLAGTMELEFQSGHPSQPTSIAGFVRRRSSRKYQQLCVGFPIFVLNNTEIAPLLFSPVSVEQSDSRLLLRTEDMEPSYAALRSLGLSEEEIALLLAECASVQTEPGRAPVEAIEEFLIGKLAELLGNPVERVPWNGKGTPRTRPNTLCNAPCLFWVQDNIATQNLIRELRELAAANIWEAVPVALKEMLAGIPEQDYPSTVPFDQDQNIYVTEINEQQRHAVEAMKKRNVTVVTGPPGTGKSQLVLNMVAQALLGDESVLFASRNNKAVDVVMSRLQGELGFIGSVRTGNKANRQQAAANMAVALNRISIARALPSIPSLRLRHSKLKAEATKAEEILYQIRELDGLIDSHQTERNKIMEILPAPIIKLVEAHAPVFRSEEVEHLQTVISSLLTTAFGLRDDAERIEKEILAIVCDNSRDSALLAALARFEERWGTFGGGFLHVRRFHRLEDCQGYVQTWLSLAPAFEVQGEVTHLSNRYRDLSSSYVHSYEDLRPQMQQQVAPIASGREANDLSVLVAESAELAERARAISEGRQSLWQKLLTKLGLIHPRRRIAERLSALERGLELESEEWPSPGPPDAELLAVACSEMAEFLQSCVLKKCLDETSQLLELRRDSLLGCTEGLSQAIRDDICRVELTEVDSAKVVAALEPLLANVQALVEQRNQLAARINTKLEANEDSLQILADFQATPAGKDKRLWTLRIPCRLDVVIRHLTKWRNLTLLLTTNANLEQLQRRAKSLPTEAEASAKVDQLLRERLTTAADIMKAQWLGHAKGLDTPTLERAYNYVSALQQLSAGYDANSYGDQKYAEERYLPSALSVFPIWATTNLAAKTNLPLVPGLFDTVIIDEASQCDVPSALPLLYRAKRIVIIGDPNQLKHVATLFEDSDLDAARQFDVAPEAFLYNSHSLFDIAERSTGARPGTLLLKEHYRSDPRIIGFSNEEFYDGELLIRTNMMRRGIPKDMAKISCGVFWLHASGMAEHPPKGSALNHAEIRTVQQLVPRLLETLARHRMSDATLGIVTPYREQANRLERWLTNEYGESDRVMVGTAHTFQGNERDVMIFSPVLAPGLSEGSLNWLHRTVNLLNVSVSRARNALIVVGHWDYCRGLSPESKYRRLAEYIGDRHQSMVRGVDELPFIGGKPLDIIGTLLDPSDREHNRLTLRKLITSCRQFVWWMDPYLQNHAFDLFWDVFQHSDVDLRDVRLLTSIEQARPTDGSRPKIDEEKARALRGELRRRGTSFQVGFLAKNQLPHDRYLYSVGQSINMPPFGGAYGDHKHVSEYTESKTNPSFFEEYWDRAKKT